MRTAFTAVNTTAVAPTPIAIDRTAMAVTSGARHSIRNASRMSESVGIVSRFSLKPVRFARWPSRGGATRRRTRAKANSSHTGKLKMEIPAKVIL